MGKTQDLIKKIRDIKGTFHVRMGTIRSGKVKDLKDAVEIKKRWQEYTERIHRIHKKGLNDLDNQHDVITHLKPDILECEKWTLGSITMNKTSEVKEFQLSYFKS